MDAADSASAAATNMVNSASRLGSLIAEAVADAAQRVLSGKWTDEESSGGSTLVDAARRQAAARRHAAQDAARKASRRKTRKPPRASAAKRGERRARPAHDRDQAPLERGGAQAPDQARHAGKLSGALHGEGSG